MNTAVIAASTLDIHCLLRIVDAIYAAACGEATWHQALAQVCRFGGFGGGALRAVDTRERRCTVLAACDTTLQGPASATLPPAERLRRLHPGDVLEDREIRSGAMPAGTSRRSGDGVHGQARVVVGREEHQVIFLEVQGGFGPAPDRPDPGAFLRQLAPHLVRAWRIGRASRAALASVPQATIPPRPHADVDRAAALTGLPQAARLRAEFGLTKAEARLALHLAEGSSLASAAQAFGVKLTTIRSQLQQIFAKTGTSRQSELVAMLLCRGFGSRTSQWHPGRSGPVELALPG